MAMYAAVLDESVAEMAAVAADPRHFDRLKIYRLADIWDNNTFPFFRAALMPTRWLRDRWAAAGLRWMAGFSAERRAWMISRVGPDLAKVLGRPPRSVPYYRDYRNLVHASTLPLDAAALAADYDLARAVVTAVSVERAGDRLTADVAMTVPRLFPVAEPAVPPTVTVSVGDLREFTFDSTDAGTAGVAVTEERVSFGARSRFAGTEPTVYVSDDRWHLSRAGRAADAVTPRRNRRRRRLPPEFVSAPEAAVVLFDAMLQLRTVRHGRLAGRVPVGGLCRTLAGAGTRILEAADAQRAGDEAAFDRLAAEWVRPHPDVEWWLTRELPEESPLRKLAAGFGGTRIKPVPPFSPDAALHEASARLTAAVYGVERAALTVNYAAPAADGAWVLYSDVTAGVGRFELSTAAFTRCEDPA
ncbi:hypothetical protein GCM10010168_29290 [Actinoplanes ianthinogenes]|uniref:Uncharacterized protein n=2 Tax=Actinoplanes ianthinogenes TaxID=122358 RepID=A0ABM7LLC1_9ACTN|nr:hypothetical protein Aiant_07280 [Actinoplanes ianthinogenes]GGR10074.1 hypothetical protein GCM10010168_29290 [Actinoplanes ianthinogenes]